MNVVILNDTRADLHHGCSRVMRLLEEGLTAQGLAITARSPVRHDWQNDAAILAAIAKADLIVINGEGTLHHGRANAARLLAVTDVAGDTPVALVNALFQDNPPEWAKWLKKLAYIATRDSRSADEIEARIGWRPVVIPDLSLSNHLTTKTRTGAIVIGDSVDPAMSAALARLARQGGHPLVPSLSVLKRPKGRTALGRMLRNWWIGKHLARAQAANPTLHLCKTEDDYAAVIASANLHVTGRFHGVCYAIAARTPFMAVTSNSWKIEALLADAGLAPWRVTNVAGVAAQLDRGAADLAFSEAELAAVDRFLERANTGAAAMYADLRGLIKT